VTSTPPAQLGPQPSWTLGNLPASGSGVITVTVRVKPGAALGAALTSTATLAPGAGELETENNSAAWLVQLSGGQMFLPLLSAP
jgi:hypothetical protein